MKVVVTSVVRNEADVIEVFVRHHAEIADEIVVIDHMSADATSEILRELAAEGLPLVVQTHDGASYNQSNIVTAQVRSVAHERSADWIIPLDADEFTRKKGAIRSWPDPDKTRIDLGSRKEMSGGNRSDRIDVGYESMQDCE